MYAYVHQVQLLQKAHSEVLRVTASECSPDVNVLDSNAQFLSIDECAEDPPRI